MHDEIDWSDIEPRILPHVKALREAGYKTTGSCGHDMWITVDLEPADLPELHSALRRLGYRDFEITYKVHEWFHRWTTVQVKFGGDLAGDGKPFDLVLLKVNPEAHPLYFVIHARRWPHTRDGDTNNDQYYYDKHTCPTNWTGNILAVISQCDEDPHGFATFERRIAPPEAMNLDDDDLPENLCWKDLFPEVALNGQSTPNRRTPIQE